MAVWCQADNCFLIDESGVVFSDVSEADKELLRIVDIDYEEDLNLGKEVVVKENLFLLLELASKIKSIEGLGVSIQELELVSDERINVVTIEGWRIFVNPKKEVDWQLAKLEVDLREEIPYDKRKDLEYIELRFNNFAPYKYQE